MGKQLVLAFFENEAAADQAVDAVKQWDKASKEIKLGAIGILVKDDKGKIKTHKLGKRKTGTGAVVFRTRRDADRRGITARRRHLWWHHRLFLPQGAGVV